MAILRLKTLFQEEYKMFWLGLSLGFVLGGNLGVLVMALFKSNRD